MIDRFRICILVSLVLVSSGLKAQAHLQSEVMINDTSWIEIGGFGSSNKDWNPFWLHSNQWGVVPKKGSGGMLGAGFKKLINLHSSGNGLKLMLGAEAVENITSSKANFILPQAYGGFRFKNWELFVGRKKQQFGLSDSTMSLGAYAMSGNALPIPKIQLGVFRFTPVPFTKKWLYFLASYSDGVFERNRPVTKELKLHQKQLYLRIGKDDSRIKLYGGGNHQVQWGGKSPFYTDSSGQMPNTLADYWLAITAARAPGRKGYFLPSHDSTNRVGNHLGSVDLAIEIETYGATWLLYRQSVYEDGSLFKLTNLQDGLNGIRFKRKNFYGADFEISEALVEFLYTKNQGGDVWDDKDGKSLGRDNYFNHAQVRDGWTYNGRTIGSPFLTPTEDTRWRFGDWGGFISNNRVWVAHFGLKGTFLQSFYWTLKASYSSNEGLYDNPFESTPYQKKIANQLSGYISIRKDMQWLGGTSIKGTFSMDKGDLYPDSYGFGLSFIKTGIF